MSNNENSPMNRGIRISDPVMAPYEVVYNHKGFSVYDGSSSTPDKSLMTFHDLGTVLGYITTNIMLQRYSGGVLSLSEFMNFQNELHENIHKALTGPSGNSETTDQEATTIEVEPSQVADIQ